MHMFLPVLSVTSISWMRPKNQGLKHKKYTLAVKRKVSWGTKFQQTQQKPAEVALTEKWGWTRWKKKEIIGDQRQ